jgi:release factor glutamine methyltransferase
MPPQTDDSSIASQLLQAVARLAEGPHPNRSRLDAESLLLHTLDCGKAWLMAHGSDPLSPLDATRFHEFIDRRLTGEPIQYILGEAEFYGLPFRVSPAVLIPRPETEHLVEKALELAATFPSPRILDIGAGSGAIAVAVAHQLAKQAAKQFSTQQSGFVTGHDFSRAEASSNMIGALAPEEKLGIASVLKGHGFSRADKANIINGALAPEGPSFSVTAVDLSPEALAVARENAERNGVSIRFLQGDLLAPVTGEPFDLILSNPPYIPTTDGPSLSVEVRDHEPSLALFAGEDGLGIYRRLIPAAWEHLVPGGFLLLEIGYGQQPGIEELLAALGFTAIGFIPDLQGIPRVACARRADAP